MTFQVRPATQHDSEELLALAPRLTEGVAEWRDPQAVREAVVGWVRESIAKSRDDDGTVLVADREGSIVGFVSVAFRTHWSGALDGYIGELVVSPEAERIGVGSALVRAAVEWCRAQGLERVSVDTGSANIGARRLYEALDFAYEGVTLSIATT